MIISQIKPSKQHLNTVIFNDGTEVSLDKDICILNSLMPDMEIEGEFLKQLIYNSDYSRAKSRALWYLDRMDYTSKKLYEKLISKGFDKKICAQVIGKLCDAGIVDDRRYAERFADRLLSSKVSKREALQKMLYRGVPYELAKEVLSEFEVDEEEQLAELIENKYTDKLQGENGYQKVYAALIRKGFSYGAVKTALKKFTEDIEFSEEY